MEILNTFQSIWTVIVFLIFIGIVLWAWSGKNKTAFDEAARIPLEDDDVISGQNVKQEKVIQKKENPNG